MQATGPAITGMTPVYTLSPGGTPLLVSVPHAGTRLPESLSARLTPAARKLPDTDWFVDRLYRRVTDLGAGLLIARYSRYLIDLNRPPDDATLYASAGPGLLPLETFSGEALYRDGQQPAADEALQRRRSYWQPYHDALGAELKALKKRHGFALLLDAHSIRGEVPALFAGTLPDLNLGSNKGASADAELIAAAMAALKSRPEYSRVLDGRFQGGYITRHYGQPHEGVHALQLEMAQSVYMQESPPVFDEGLAAAVEPLLMRLVGALLEWRP